MSTSKTITATENRGDIKNTITAELHPETLRTADGREKVVISIEITDGDAPDSIATRITSHGFNDINELADDTIMIIHEIGHVLGNHCTKKRPLTDLPDEVKQALTNALRSLIENDDQATTDTEEAGK